MSFKCISLIRDRVKDAYYTDKPVTAILKVELQGNADDVRTQELLEALQRPVDVKGRLVQLDFVQVSPDELVFITHSGYHELIKAFAMNKLFYELNKRWKDTKAIHLLSEPLE